jgi:hypothetical protein
LRPGDERTFGRMSQLRHLTSQYPALHWQFHVTIVLG